MTADRPGYGNDRPRCAAMATAIVEIGCVELVDRKPTGRRLHRYINPEREVPVEAQRIHGLTDEFLADKPRFARHRRRAGRLHPRAPNW